MTVNNDEIAETPAERRAKRKATLFALGVGLLCLLLWLGNAWLGYWFWDKDLQLGSVGDGQGLSNSLFAAFAFIGIFYSVILQRDELRIARRDSNRMKDVMTQQEHNIAEQQRQANQLNFDRTFFDLMSQFNEITNSLSLNITRLEEDVDPDTSITNTYDVSVDATGKSVFRELLIEQRRVLCHGLFDEASFTQGQRLHHYQSQYRLFFGSYGHLIGHYFRSLYTILRFVHESSVSDKEFYAKFLRAQLSNDEATLLMNNYISPMTTRRFNYLVTRYGMLKNANTNDINGIFFRCLKNEFDVRAFGKDRQREMQDLGLSEKKWHRKHRNQLAGA